MGMELFKKIIDDATQYDLESLDCCGFGDCFLDNKLFEKFDYVKQRMPDIDIFVSTNGFHMEYCKWDDIIKYIGTLKLSIYGMTKKVHEAFHRGKVKFNPTMANILGYLYYVKDKYIKPYTIGLYLLDEINEGEKEAWIDFWQPKLNEVFVWKPHNWVYGRSYREIKSNQISCGRPANGPMYIQADGTVSVCCFDINKELVVGDIRNQTIEQIYKSEAYNKIREAHKNNDFAGLICKGCDQTNHDKSVLVYKTNRNRQVGEITSNYKKVI